MIGITTGFGLLAWLLVLIPFVAMAVRQDAVRVFKSAVSGKYFREQGHERSRDFSAAGIIVPGDVSGVEAVTILDEVLGRAYPKYILRNICRPIRMDKLTMNIDVATKMTGREKVKPMIEAEISAEDYTRVPFDLWKNVVHVAVVDEAQMKASHDVLGMNIDSASMELARMENKQIGEIAEENITEKADTVVYADWGLRTTPPDNDTDPLIAIVASMAAIEGAGHTPDFMALHPGLWAKFITNSYIRTLVHSDVMKMTPAGPRFSLPGWPQMAIYISNALTEVPTGSVGPIVGSRMAPGLVLGQGPTVAARYRDEPKGYFAYIIRQWLEPLVILDEALDMICT